MFTFLHFASERTLCKILVIVTIFLAKFTAKYKCVVGYEYVPSGDPKYYYLFSPQTQVFRHIMS